MPRCGLCGPFTSEFLRRRHRPCLCVSHRWQCRPRTTSGHEKHAGTDEGSSDALTAGLLQIAVTMSGQKASYALRYASQEKQQRWRADGTSSVGYAPQRTHADTSAHVAPELLRVLLLKSRHEATAASTVHHIETTAPHVSSPKKLSDDAGCRSSTPAATATALSQPAVVPHTPSLACPHVARGSSWCVAFRLFSEAVQQHAVVPSIEHINVLLGITVQERCWRQKEQVEMFVERFLESAHAMCREEEQHGQQEAVIVENAALKQLVHSLQATEETYEWLMEAAVSQHQWVEALMYFQDAREDCLPVTDASLRLALEAYRIGGVHTVINTSNAAINNKSVTPLVPLRTDQRGPVLHRAAAATRPTTTISLSKQKRTESETQFLWEAAKTLFLSYRHRVRGDGTVALFLSMMAEAGQHEVLLDVYRDCSRTVCLGDDALALVSSASREVGDWALGLHLLQDAVGPHTGAGESLAKRILEDTLHALRRAQHYTTILQLHVQLPSTIMTPRARVAVAQAAMVRRDLPLLLRLLEETADDAGLDHAVSRCHAVFEPNVTATPATCVQVEVYNTVLRAIQVELIRRYFCVDPEEVAGSSQHALQDLAALSVAVYERFLYAAKRQLRAHSSEDSDAPLSVYAPLVRLLDSCESATSSGRVDGTRQAPWEAALAHVSLIRRPDAIVVSLATDLMRKQQQWEAAFGLLASVMREEVVTRSVEAPCRRGAAVAQEALRYGCTTITAAAVRHAVCSAANESSAALHLTQHAFSHGWIDGGMALQLLEGIQRGVGDAHVQRNDRECLAEGVPHSQTDAVSILVELVALHKRRTSGVGPFASLFFDAMQVLQHLQIETEPPTELLYALHARLAEIVARISGEWQDERRAEAAMAVTAVLHAVWQQVSQSTLSRWTLWQECLRCLEWFRSPLAPHLSGALPASEATLRVLRAFVYRCDRPEEGFVEGVAVRWLLCGASPLCTEVLVASLDAAPGLVDRTVWMSHELLLDALVWASRHRTKTLVRRIVRLLLPFLSRLLRNDGAVAASPEGPHGRLRSEAVTAVTIVLQCMTSGPHQEVLNDWPLVRLLLAQVMQTHELASSTAGVSALAEGLAAVLDKLRRTFHFLIVKISLDAHRRRSQGGEKTAVAVASDAEDLENLVEDAALAYMDLCRAFPQNFFAAIGDGCVAQGDVARCLEKVLNCVWDVNYTLYVWHTSFSPTTCKKGFLQLLQDRYRWLLCLQVSLLPVSCTTPLCVERWLVVMSRGSVDAATARGTSGNALSASLVHDITTLEAWQDCHTEVLSPEVSPPPQQQQQLSRRQFVVPRVLEAIHSITCGVTGRTVSSSSGLLLPTTGLAAASTSIPTRTLPPLVNGRSASSLFEDHLALVSPQQLQAMQQAGCTLVYVMLCEGRAHLPQMLLQSMSWSCCPRSLLGAIVEAAQSTSRVGLAAAWNSDALVSVFDALGMQSRYWVSVGDATCAVQDGVRESQAAALLRLLTTLPAVRAVARVDEAICTAALLALEPADVAGDKVGPGASVRHTLCRLLSAFPKIVEKRLLSLLLGGQLHESQMCVVDAVVRHIAHDFSGRRSFTCSPALMRASAMWLLLRGPHEASRAAPHCAAAPQVFAEVMLSASPTLMVGGRMKAIRHKLEHHAACRREELERAMRGTHMEQVLSLLTDARGAAAPHVDLVGAFLAAMEFYGGSVPPRWKEEFVVGLMEQWQRNRCRGDSHCGHPCSLIGLLDEVAHMPALWKSFLMQHPVKASELWQLGKMMDDALRQARVEHADAHTDVWRAVLAHMRQLLRDRSTTADNRPAGEVALRCISRSCAAVERFVVHMLRHGVSAPSPLETRPFDVDVSLVALSLLLLVELAAPGRAVHFALHRLYDETLVDEKALNSISSRSGDGSPPVSAPHDVWRSLVACEVQFLTLPGLIDNDSAVADYDAPVWDALTTTEAVVELLFRFVCGIALRLGFTAAVAAAARGGNRGDGEAEEEEELLRLLELSGRRVVSLLLALLSDTAGAALLQERHGDAVRCIVGRLVQSALLVGAWRDIYWLASRLLVSLGTALARQKSEQEQEKFASSWLWVVGLLPSMVAGSARTTSSLEPQITNLVEALPLAVLQQLHFASSDAADHDGGGYDGDAETRRRRQLRCLLLKLHQKILLKTAGVLRGAEKRSGPFIERLSLVQPLVQLGVLLAVHNADCAQVASLRVSFLFFLSDQEWLQLVESVAAESDRTSSAAVAAVGSFSVTGTGGVLQVACWQEALTVICRTHRETFAVLPHKRQRGRAVGKELQELQDALCVFHAACIANEVPFSVMMKLFCDDNGPPHTAQVFPAFYTERVVRQCPSWSASLRLLEQSLSTVRHPTQVQQLLAYLILQRMRTDPAWASSSSSAAAAALPTLSSPLLLSSSSSSSSSPVRGKDEGGGLLSWEVACWCYQQLTCDAVAPPLPQRSMIEMLRHCVFKPSAALAMYEAYWRQGYHRTEGVNVFLSLLRAARLERSESMALQAMRDYICCCDEHDRVLSEASPGTRRHHIFTSEGNTSICRSFARVCESGIVSRSVAAEVAAALKQRGRIGDVEELLMVGPCREGQVVATNTKGSKGRLPGR
ncbi:hypothetical protein DQ04_02441040 [Trypanosoma grayi]|uniref:hypothetical protein n=1 Tax=Trypanosoma grayi TaxID=71804 RepID=UPI0004F466F3|nr:hypothetical protein DQ04_02441040 [Trypanosoma grayi]KEG11615.1 hypothetical protein DQ04_02441040 [Trypanosoma grayi]